MEDDLTPGDILLLVEKLADLGTWRFDVDDFAGIMSPQALKMLGLPKGHGPRVDAAEWNAIYGEEQVEAARRAIHASVKTGEVYRMELPVHAAEGAGTRWMLSVGKAFDRAHGPELIGFNMDITRTKQAEIERDNARDKYDRCARAAAVNAGAACVIHEIMQPLTAAASWIGAARLLADRSEVSPELQDALRRAQSSVDEAGRIARATRRFLRDGTAEPAAVDILEILRGVLADFEARTVRPLKIGIDTRGHARTLYADPMLLKQLFANIVANAIDASDDQSPISIDIIYRHKGGRHLLIFRDYGRGLDEQVKPRTARAFAPSEKGLGLGLWLCSAIARLHGGRLRIAGARPGAIVQVQLSSIWIQPVDELAADAV